jgi:hypothetical protein
VDSDGHTPETGVVFNTSGIDLKYRREGAVSVDITEVALSSPALNDAHADGGILHIGSGYYRLDLPDAACAAGASGVIVHGVVTNMIVHGCYIHLEPIPADVVEALGAVVMISGAAITGTLSASSMTTNLTEATDDHYVDRTIIWTTGVLAGSSARITSYNGTTKALTFSGSTQTGEAPSNNDEFIIF